ncbi:MAG: polysaccharide pyruvyl transferase family protein [Sedimentisphaerales bacterium]|nr:polysaccharide pyruvyl transferase family protein [Sedimentisphaerales bacterium]
MRRTLFAKRPRIGYIGGYHGHKNLGDEALYAALKRLYSFGCFLDYNRGLVPGWVARLLPRCDLMLMAGGTNVAGHKESSYRWAKTCFSLAPHCIVFGSGVAAPEFESAVMRRPLGFQKQWAEILKNCVYIGVRGPLSKRILDDLGVQNVEVIGDPVLTLAGERNVIASDNIIGFNVSQAGGNVWGGKERIFQQFVKLAQIAAKAGFRIRWFVVSPDDLSVTQQVIRESGSDADVYEFYEDYSGFMDAVSCASVFVGVRLHSVALATCAYVPSLMLEYNPKCRDFMESIKQAEFNLRTDKFTAGRAWEIISYLLSNRSAVAGRLFDAVSKFRSMQFLKSCQICSELGLKHSVKLY